MASCPAPVGRVALANRAQKKHAPHARTHARPALFSLPPELFYGITAQLDRASLNALLRSCRSLAGVLTHELYARAVADDCYYVMRLHQPPHLVPRAQLDSATVRSGRGVPLLQWLCRAPTDSPDTITKLLAHGASANTVDGHGRTPLHSAACRGHLAIARVLLEHGRADAAARSEKADTPLHLAAAWGHAHVAHLLLATPACAPVDAQNDYGAAPLHAAIRMEQPAVVRVLLEYGASVALKDHNGSTPVMLAKSARSEEVRRLMRVLGVPGTRSAEAEVLQRPRAARRSIGRTPEYFVWSRKDEHLNVPTIQALSVSRGGSFTIGG